MSPRTSKFNYLFPGAFMVNTFAMTILLVILGLAGRVAMAAEIGIVQGATLALFYAFSANARSLILNPASKISVQSIMASRLILLVPLAGAAYLLSIAPAEVERFVAIALILRRCAEWLGEVHLSEMERLGNKGFTWKYLILQVILLVVVLAWLLGDFPFPLLGLFIWALTPLIMSAGYIWKSFVAIPDALVRVSSSILPHLGSTTIIGITVYIFRLLILLILGKEAAGDLFTAFAIGGLTGGVFANALGPSVVLHEQRSGKRHFPFMLSMVLYLSLVLGIVVFAAAILAMPVLNWTGKSSFFWMAAGLSIIGGVIMVHAQRIRLRLLQNGEEQDVFAPDVMMNILLIAAVPFTYYLLGLKAMGGLYLLSSLLALVFYSSSKGRENSDQQSQPVIKKIRMAIPIMLLFPIFFQVSNGVFRDTKINFDSGGVLVNLPIPLSVLACYAGIILLGGYKRAFISCTTIFFACIFMTMTAIISTQSNPVQQQAKLVLLIQFILPMFALILGQVYDREKIGDNGPSYEKMFLYVLAIIIPAQLIATFSQGFVYLVPSLGLFSIYQSLQYVPLVLVSAYLIALFALWQSPKQKLLLLVLAPLMAIYVAASISIQATGMLLIGLLGLAAFQWISSAEKLPVIVFLLVAVLSCSYLQYVNNNAAANKFNFLNKTSLQDKSVPQQPDNTSPNVREHMVYWKYYARQIATSPKAFFIGHGEALDRSSYPSAHNYYLDFVYNFGFIALVPILTILAYTCALTYRHRRKIYLLPGMIGLCFVVLFLLLIDNSFKVGLRQPYPGIFTFFLWGLLLSRLLNLNSVKGSR
jgi:MFS family permease